MDIAANSKLPVAVFFILANLFSTLSLVNLYPRLSFHLVVFNEPGMRPIVHIESSEMTGGG